MPDAQPDPVRAGRRLDEDVSAVTQPLYDRHRGDLAVELLHGGRWIGHSAHTALSDLPIGFWSGAFWPADFSCLRRASSVVTVRVRNEVAVGIDRRWSR